MRVAIITENFLPKLDGVTRTLAYLLEHLQENGHQALLLGPESGMDRVLDHANELAHKTAPDRPLKAASFLLRRHRLRSQHSCTLETWQVRIVDQSRQRDGGGQELFLWLRETRRSSRH